MTLETVVPETVNRYCDNEIMLDALLQWASNPTSMSAGYGVEENYPYIAKNLAARHGISRSEAEKRVAELRGVCRSLGKEADSLPIEPRYRTGEIQRALGEALGREPLQRVLRQGALRRLREVSDETRRALLMFVLLGKAGSTVSPDDLRRPRDRYSDRQSEFQAYCKAVFGDIVPTVRVVDEMVRCGAYSELYWVPSPTAKGSAGPTFVKAVVPTVEEIEAAGTKLPPPPDVPTFIESAWRNGDFDLLRLVDIVGHSYLGIMTTEEPLPVKTNIPGFMGLHGQSVGLSPVVATSTRQQVEVVKSERMEDSRHRVEDALVSVARKFGADAALGVVWTGMGEVLWKFELTASPAFYVYLAPWLTTFAQSPGLSRINLSEKPHVLFVIPYQSRPSILGCLERTSGYSLKDTSWEKSLGLISDLQKPQEFQLLVGQRHRLLDASLAELEGRESAPRIERPETSQEPVGDQRPGNDIGRQAVKESVPRKEGTEESLVVWLGGTPKGQEVYWKPGNSNNGHLIIVGGSGAGKTELIRCIVAELDHSRFPVLMIDFHGDMSPATGAHTTKRYDIRERSPYYFNPLELDQRFPEITPLRATSDFLDAMAINFPALGVQQKNRLREIIKQGYLQAGITTDQTTWSRELPFSAIQQEIQNSDDATTQTLRAYLDDIFDYALFTGETKFSINDVLESGITHINLKPLPESLRSLHADLFLRKLYYTLQSVGEIPRGSVGDRQRFRAFVVVDEAKLLVSEKQGIKAVLNKYATEMRKFGVGLTLASQIISHFNDEILANVGAKVCMNAETQDQAKANGKTFGIDERVLMHLRPGQAFFLTAEGQVELQVVPSWERSLV